MERNIDFKNFVITETKITGEIYCDGKYVMELGCKLNEITQETNSQIALYRYFKHAAITYLKITATYPFNSDTIH